MVAPQQTTQCSRRGTIRPSQRSPQATRRRLPGLPGLPGLPDRSAGPNSVNVETVNVNVASGDPDVIAAGIADALTEQLHDTAENFDSDVAR